MELHFYPGSHILIVKEEGKLKLKFPAWGGPASMGTDIRMPEEPTWPGTYLIHSAKPYRTPTWPMSKIFWGTRLMDKPKRNDIWYELRNGRWGSVKNDIGIARTDLIRLYFSMYGQMKVPNKWVFNDFGPIAIRWFKDVNGNGKLDESERLSGQMFHTTPDNEAQQALGQTVTLSSSHGCIHLKPADRDRLLSVGAFSPGAVFIVHKYHEKP